MDEELKKFMPLNTTMAGAKSKQSLANSNVVIPTDEDVDALKNFSEENQK